MWTGWPTFPMVFVKGTLVGGADDLQKLHRQRRAGHAAGRRGGLSGGPRGCIGFVLVGFNKPFRVLCQFTDRREPARPTLAGFGLPSDIYAAGRLDFDSEGLLLLTDDGALNQRLSNPRWKAPKTYLVQVEGEPDDAALESLRRGVTLKDGLTLPARARRVASPEWLWAREPAVRYRKTVPDAFIELTIREGRNRQVRRMTAAVGFPTLRLVRTRIGPYSLASLAPGAWRPLDPASLGPSPTRARGAGSR